MGGYERFQKDTFIDVGKALDGYAGKHHQGFPEIAHYCNASRAWQPLDGMPRQWMATEVDCTKQEHVEQHQQLQSPVPRLAQESQESSWASRHGESAARLQQLFEQLTELSK